MVYYIQTYLHVHVAVHGHQVPLVLHPPLQLHHHRLSRETVQKGLGVQWQTLQKSSVLDINFEKICIVI